MKITIRKFFVGLTASMMLMCTSAFADPLTYHIAGSGSGLLNGVSFSNSSFEFFLTGEAANLIDPLSNASVSIAGLGTTTFSIPTRLGVCCGSIPNAIFFSRAGSLGGADLFDFLIGPPDGWSLAAPFTPITGSSVFALNQFVDIGTSAGPLTFLSSTDVQFWAGSVAAIPEPETYAMLLAGLGLLGFAARRRKLKEAAAA